MQKKDLVITADLLESLKDYDTEEVAQFMEKLFPAMIALFRNKDKNYGGSWQNKGIFSAHSNFERKIDRINTQFYNGTITEKTNENISDTFIDNSIYSMMYLFFLARKLPEVKAEVEKFIVEKTTV